MKTPTSLHKCGLFVIGLMFAVSGFAQSVLTNGLVAYYPFNGNANDASGNGNNGTVSGATPTTDRFGNANQAYYFNGSSAFITVPVSSSAFSNDFTASVWFNAYDMTNAWPTLFDEQGNSAFRSGIVGQISGGSGIGYLYSYSAYAPATFAWFMRRQQQTPLNTFCQVVVSKAGTNVTMFFDGQIVASNQVVSPAILAGQYLKIGRQDIESVPGDTAFHGVIDDVRLYSRALSTNEVAQLYAIESAPTFQIKKAVYLSDNSLYVGSNYQVQVSTDMTNWTNSGSPFTATSSSWSSTNLWPVDNWNQLFFRLLVAP